MFVKLKVYILFSSKSNLLKDPYIYKKSDIYIYIYTYIYNKI